MKAGWKGERKDVKEEGRKEISVLLPSASSVIFLHL